MKAMQSENFRIRYPKKGDGDVYIEIEYEPHHHATLILGDVKDLHELGDLITAVRRDVLPMENVQLCA